MASMRQPWAIVLAGGEGSRVRGLTCDAGGSSVPKQFWRFEDEPSLLERTLRRAQCLTPLDRVVPVVAEHHRRWWRPQLRHLPAGNVVVQSVNRGTATGLLAPLLQLFWREFDALVMILPSDHHARDERPLEDTLHRAIQATSNWPGSVMLLGIEPDAPDPDYGWVLPGPGRGAVPITRFVEKPPVATAADLMRRGALWNSFMLVATARALLGLYEAAQPELLAASADYLRAHGWQPERLPGLERTLPFRDFSRDILEHVPERLRVLRVPPCGWTHLGTPARLAAWMTGQRAMAASSAQPAATLARSA
jgi:mannose-1-phosphate guanylyltransferase